jgi:hypothetical protein
MIEENKSWVDEIVDLSNIKEVTLVRKDGKTFIMTSKEFINDMKNTLMSGMLNCNHVEFIAYWFGVDPKKIKDR